MRLVALVGGVGEDKTGTLSRWVALWQAEGRTVDGFLALAGPRSREGCGADWYDLRFVRAGRRLRYVTREEGHAPPYQEDPQTVAAVAAWASSLAEAQPEIVVLDEFSRFEAEGGGHLHAWPGVVAARPRLAVLAVRTGCEEAIQPRLGQRFDEVLTAADPRPAAL